MCQPNHSYAESMFRLHSDHTRGCGVAGVLYSVWPTNARDYPAVLFIGLWPHRSHKIMYLYSICLVSTAWAAVMPPSHYIVGHCKVLGMSASTISRRSNKPTSCTWGFPRGCPTVPTIGRLVCNSVNAMGPG